MNVSTDYDVIIAGAGPAGSSAAIHLANHDVRVLLIEQKVFPRPKLCGEFISPECIEHFQRLGVAPEMEASQPAQILETVFYSRRGRKIVVPSGWFGGVAAFGLSRAAMDQNLLQRARSIGVDVLEGVSVSGLVKDKNGLRGVFVKSKLGEQEYAARVIVDATGRTRALARQLDPSPMHKAKLVAFKAHLKNARGAASACEIYSYPNGYGGLSTIEDGLSNLCFIIDAECVRRAHSDPDEVVRQWVTVNRRAAFTLEAASVQTPWLSVALESFGRLEPSPANGLLTIGDSAAFIDPFTGSGMLMALESGELASQQIVRYLNKSTEPADLTTLGANYRKAYRNRFDSRLRLCGLLRRVAYRPYLAQLTISMCSISDDFRSWLARSTRSSSENKTASPRLT